MVEKGKESNVKKEIALPPSVNAPVSKGDKIGEIIVTLDGDEVGRMDIVSKEDVPKASVVDILGRIFNKMMGN